MKQFDVTISYTLGERRGTWERQISAPDQTVAIEQAKAAILVDHPGATPEFYNCLETNKPPRAKLRLVVNQ